MHLHSSAARTRAHAYITGKSLVPMLTNNMVVSGLAPPPHHKSVYRALLWNIETHPEKLFFASVSQCQGMQEF